jgi:hypothetical protein
VQLCRELGGWDERLAANEDFEFDYRIRRAGHRILLDPRLRIEWRCRESVPALFAQYRRYGRGKAAMTRLHPEALSARHLAPPALVANLALAAAILPWRPRWSAALCAPYLAALLLATARTAADLDGRGSRRYLAPAFVAMHVGWGIGFYRGLLVPTRSGAVEGDEPAASA